MALHPQRERKPAIKLFSKSCAYSVYELTFFKTSVSFEKLSGKNDSFSVLIASGSIWGKLEMSLQVWVSVTRISYHRSSMIFLLVITNFSASRVLTPNSGDGNLIGFSSFSLLKMHPATWVLLIFWSHFTASFSSEAKLRWGLHLIETLQWGKEQLILLTSTLMKPSFASFLGLS